MREIDASVVALSEVRTPSDFAACLDQLRVLAGPLSHREIASRSGGLLRRTKIGQVLAGELPRRDFLAAYLDVCGVPEDAAASWLRVWTHLVSATRAAGRQPDDERAMLRRQRDAAREAARKLGEALETTRSSLRAAEAEREAAARHAWQAGELGGFAEGRLRAAEAAREEAVAKARLLSDELRAARARVTELTNTVTELRNDQSADRKRLKSAKEEYVRLREQLARRPEPKRLTMYSAGEAEELFGTDEVTATPTIGDSAGTSEAGRLT